VPFSDGLLYGIDSHELPDATGHPLRPRTDISGISDEPDTILAVFNKAIKKKPAGTYLPRAFSSLQLAPLDRANVRPPDAQALYPSMHDVGCCSLTSCFVQFGQSTYSFCIFLLMSRAFL
jgi:hypothetical protein